MKPFIRVIRAQAAGVALAAALVLPAGASARHCCQSLQSCRDTADACGTSETLVYDAICGQDGLCEPETDLGCCPCTDVCVEDLDTCVTECGASYFVPGGSCDDGCSPPTVPPAGPCGAVDVDFCSHVDLSKAVFCQPGVPCVGTQDADVFCGSPGDDAIVGAGGDDVVCAGGGRDHIRTGQGNDQVDTVHGCGGVFQTGLLPPDDCDRVTTKGGSDVVLGGPGNDRIGLGTGDDVAFGGGGLDKISGSAGDDCLDATLVQGSVASGGSGEDTCCAYKERRCEASCIP